MINGSLRILDVPLLFDLIKYIKQICGSDFEIYIGKYGIFDDTKELFYSNGNICFNINKILEVYNYFIMNEELKYENSLFLYTKYDYYLPGFMLIIKELNGKQYSFCGNLDYNTVMLVIHNIKKELNS